MHTLLRREEVDSLEALLHKYRGLVWRVAYRFLQDADEAQDVTQEVLMRLHGRADALRPDTRLPSWLMRVTANAALNTRRRNSTRRRYHQAAYDTTAANPLPAPGDALIGQRLQEALASLPRGQRAVVTLRLLEERTFREIAATFGVAEGTVKVQFARGLRRLRSEMEGGRRAPERGGEHEDV